MKKKGKSVITGIFIALAVFGLAFAACSSPAGGGDHHGDPTSKLTVYELPSDATYAVYIFSSETDISTFSAITNALNSGSYQAGGAYPSGNVFNLWNGVSATNAWKGSGSLPVVLVNTSGSATDATNPMFSWTIINFSNGNGAASFSSFTAVVYSDGSETEGTLTINNLPDGVSYVVGVYNHSGTISDILEWASVASDIIAVGSGTASSSMTLYAANTTTGFTGTGSYMVALYTTTAPITVLYKTGVSFTDGCATVNYAEMTDLLGNAPEPGDDGTKGKLTINNLPSGNSLAITIYNYDGEITSQTGLTTIQADLTKLVAVSFGVATSSPASLIKSGGSTSTFDGTGTYLILMAVNTTSLRYAEQVTFTNGCAEINFSTLLNMSDLPLLPVDPNQNPTADDFNIGNLTQAVGNVTEVTITPKEGKSTGTITIYYNGSTTLPTAIGTYTVTFDVAASTGWSAKTGLSAGTLTIKAVDYTATSIADLEIWLASQPANTVDSAYNIVLNVSNLGGNSDTAGSAGYVLKTNNTKYVNLDLSGNTFTSLGHTAFSQCTSLTGITMPNSITDIGWGAISNCTNLTSVTIPNSVNTISESAFSESGLTSITIPSSVTKIEDHAFWRCTSLTSVTFQGTITSNNFATSFFYTFPGDLRDKYLAVGGGIGTYTRPNGDSTTWTKIDNGNACTVTFDSNGGSTVSPVTVTNGNKISAPTAPTKSGYTFDNWYKNSGLTTLWDFNTDTVTSDITLYAKYYINYMVTFNTDGGTPVPAQQSIRDGGLVTRPTTAPAKSGYTFDNWYKDSGLTTLWNFTSDTVTSDITIYAKFSLGKYTVTFNTDSGTPVPTQQSIEHGGLVTRPATNPAKTGYTFVNWYKDSGFTTLWNFNTDTVTSSVTIYAKFNLNQYTVTFNSNDGSAVAPQTVNHGSTASRPANPTKANYGFIDWYSNEGLTTIYNFTSQVTGNITLYAKWGALAVSAEDISDFGSGAGIANTFNVSNVTEWNSAVSAINSGGNNRNYIINITASFSIPGTTSYNFTPSELNISIRGNATLSLSSNGNLLRVNQRIIIRDLTLKGRKNGVDGATSDNNASLIYMWGTVELKGTASITGNVNYLRNDILSAEIQGGGVDLQGGTFIMWDNSSITGNSVIAYGGSTSWALGGGVCVGNYGTLIMRGNSSITNNTATANGNTYTQSRFGFGGGIFVGPGNSSGGILRIEGGIISGNTANVKGSALYLYTYGVDFGWGDNSIAQYGTFSGDTWTSNGNLSTTNNSITVVNGNLQ